MHHNNNTLLSNRDAVTLHIGDAHRNSGICQQRVVAAAGKHFVPAPLRRIGASP
jgi:hypothetical protein